MIKTAAIVLGVLASVGLAACGHDTTSPSRSHTSPSPRPSHTVSASAQAIKQAMSAECAVAQTINTSVTAATTVGNVYAGAAGWQSQLTAAQHIPMTGVPFGSNPPRLIAVDFAEANVALAIASIYANPFGPHFSVSRVKRDYGLATQKLQDAVNSCAAAGVAIP
jgi:hypothetical protein